MGYSFLGWTYAREIDMEYPDFLNPVLARIDPRYGVEIRCDEGWWQLISLCDKELADIDPDYTIFQVKEKFGGLRYYHSPSSPTRAKEMNAVVAKFEHMCSMTCEKTGKHGYLMKKGFVYKTLHESFMDDGWTKVNS